MLDYRRFVSIGAAGIPLSKISDFEKTLTPIPRGLLEIFPPLNCFSGLALNIFTIRRAGDTYRIFPLSLSEHSRDLKSHLQIDLLLDSEDLREPSRVPIPQNHALLIANLPLLLARFSDKRNNARRYQYCCRSCSQVKVINSYAREYISGGKKKKKSFELFLLFLRSFWTGNQSRFTTQYVTTKNVPLSGEESHETFSFIQR